MQNIAPWCPNLEELGLRADRRYMSDAPTPDPILDLSQNCPIIKSLALQLECPLDAMDMAHDLPRFPSSGHLLRSASRDSMGTLSTHSSHSLPGRVSQQ